MVLISDALLKKCPYMDDVEFCLGTNCMAFVSKTKTCYSCEGLGRTPSIHMYNYNSEECMICEGTGKLDIEYQYECAMNKKY